MLSLREDRLALGNLGATMAPKNDKRPRSFLRERLTLGSPDDAHSVSAVLKMGLAPTRLGQFSLMVKRSCLMVSPRMKAFHALIR